MGGDPFELEEYTAKFDLVFNFTEYLATKAASTSDSNTAATSSIAKQHSEFRTDWNR